MSNDRAVPRGGVVMDDWGYEKPGIRETASELFYDWSPPFMGSLVLWAFIVVTTASC